MKLWEKIVLFLLFGWAACGCGSLRPTNLVCDGPWDAGVFSIPCQKVAALPDGGPTVGTGTKLDQMDRWVCYMQSRPDVKVIDYTWRTPLRECQ